MKVLILYPQDICYGIVHACAKNFAESLQKEGIEIVGFDPKEQDVQSFSSYLRGEYDAVIDFYSHLLEIITLDGKYIGNVIDVPVYQVLLDYPIYVQDMIDIPVKKHYVLCGNERYMDVIKKAIPHVKESYFFPMAGKIGGKLIPWRGRKKDFVFIGTYNNYRELLGYLGGYDQDIRLLAETLFDVMKKDVSLDQTAAMKKTLEIFNIDISEKEMFQWFKIIGKIAIASNLYHRERLIRTILEAGIQLDVYGKSWENSVLSEFKNLRINPQLNENDIVEVLSDTKVSLNLLYSNKSGFTERYAYSMLNGAVCLSDYSDYISENFTDKRDILFYDLQNPEDIGEKIRYVLSDPQLGEEISRNAMEKALNEHTWDCRAKSFIKIYTSNIK